MHEQHTNCTLVELTDAEGHILPAVVHENGDVSLPVGKDAGGIQVATIPSDLFDQLADRRESILEALYGGTLGDITLSA